MLGDDAIEFLKTLHKLDNIWNLQEDAEYNERQLVQFAERYHQSKVKENELLHSVSDSFKKGDCKLSCSPSDWSKEGKCGKNGCWHK